MVYFSFFIPNRKLSHFESCRNGSNLKLKRGATNDQAEIFRLVPTLHMHGERAKCDADLKKRLFRTSIRC